MPRILLGALLAIHAFGSVEAMAASCCGASSAAPTLITGDDSAQFSVSFSQGAVIGDAFDGGIPVFRADDDSEIAQTLRFDGALLLSDRWQAGASALFTRRARDTANSSSSASGLGDVSLDVGYEILPEWEYSSWRPRGFAFIQGLIPTGKSIYETSLSQSQAWGVDSRSRGFYSLGAGTIFVKTWPNWDALASFEAHKSFSRTFGADAATGSSELRIVPGWGGSLALGGGYSPDALPLRFGLALSPVYEGPMNITEDSGSSTSVSQLVWNVSAQLAWLIASQATLSATYTDQTLLGPARNVSLSRTFALLFQHRWQR